MSDHVHVISTWLVAGLCSAVLSDTRLSGWCCLVAAVLHPPPCLQCFEAVPASTQPPHVSNHSRSTTSRCNQTTLYATGQQSHLPTSAHVCEEVSANSSFLACRRTTQHGTAPTHLYQQIGHSLPDANSTCAVKCCVAQSSIHPYRIHTFIQVEVGIITSGARHSFKGIPAESVNPGQQKKESSTNNKEPTAPRRSTNAACICVCELCPVVVAEGEPFT